MSFEHLIVRSSDRIGWIEFHRPPVNAFNWEMLYEVPEALTQLLNDSDICVIVFASALEKHFSSGADLKVFEAMSQDDIRIWVESCHSLVLQMRTAQKPLLAAIHGTAVGGGLELVLHCDVRFVAEGAKLGQPEINIAFIPPVGATQALGRLLGRSRALRFLYDGTLVSAQEALEMGLVDFVVSAERLRAEMEAYAASLAKKPAGALAAIRRCITVGIERQFEEGLGIEMDAALALGGSRDFREGLQAFIEKRAPKWESDPNP
jgi:enoyl-CoA hydratase/carnithine racemase